MNNIDINKNNNNDNNSYFLRLYLSIQLFFKTKSVNSTMIISLLSKWFPI